ncbi:MAG TPA: hypothetical protein DHW61_04210 [Lachnoclostridium phytofermentans]|uniref:Uncharacterized protein n=1 Tax=Lachnoclostridium phytofermentans TaxID=66219 RepID=A0A3D2X384_9FIRM|nr:hypothetical protein [Lachnoclostridium phytofermentans]
MHGRIRYIVTSRRGVMMARIKEVAKACGVSIATVSIMNIDIVASTSVTNKR